MRWGEMTLSKGTNSKSPSVGENTKEFERVRGDLFAICSYGWIRAASGKGDCGMRTE